MNSNVILMVVIAVLVLALLLWLLANARKTRVEIEPATPNEQPARRNQALIDAPPVAASASAPSPVPPTLPVDLPLAGEAVSVPAAVRPIVAGPAATPATAAPSGESDDLTQMKGVGPKVAEQLRALGVTRFAQIAAWDDAEIDRVDAQLGRFQGRIRRDDWVTQARLLAAGDTSGYEAKFGRL